jgi:hypothetical protein
MPRVWGEYWIVVEGSIGAPFAVVFGTRDAKEISQQFR